LSIPEYAFRVIFLQMIFSPKVYHRYVAIGDSSTEGLDDLDGADMTVGPTVSPC
jgi:hypothetical protein